MTKEDEAEVQRLLNNVDVTELMDMLKKHGNRYSRRILKFFPQAVTFSPFFCCSSALKQASLSDFKAVPSIL